MKCYILGCRTEITETDFIGKPWSVKKDAHTVWTEKHTCIRCGKFKIKETEVPQSLAYKYDKNNPFRQFMKLLENDANE